MKIAQTILQRIVTQSKALLHAVVDGDLVDVSRIAMEREKAIAELGAFVASAECVVPLGQDPLCAKLQKQLQELDTVIAEHAKLQMDKANKDSARVVDGSRKLAAYISGKFTH